MYPGNGINTVSLLPGAALGSAEASLAHYTGVLQGYEDSLVVPPLAASPGTEKLIVAVAVIVAAVIVWRAS